MAESSSRKASRKAGADGYSLAQSPSHLLRRAQQYAFDIYSQETGGEELTPRQFAVLVTVEQNEGLSQTDLVRLTGIDRSTLADMIARLLKRDLLARKRTESDQRANAVKITAAGRKALRSVQAAVGRAETRILEVLPASKRGDFVKALTAFAAAADALGEGGAMAPPPKRGKAKTAGRRRRA